MLKWFLRPVLGVALLAVIAAGGFFAYRQFSAKAPPIESQTPVGDVPAVFRTNGGMLEVGKLVYAKQFKSKQSGSLLWLDVPACPTVATVSVKAHFTYRVRLAREWKAKISNGDKRVLVVAPPLELATPVAFDTATEDGSDSGGCLVLKNNQLLPDLRKQLSAKLAQAGNQDDHKRQVLEAARKTVGEFIRKWYLSHDEYAYAKDYEVVVRFKGEPIEDLM
jgi:hypothetical protein